MVRFCVSLFALIVLTLQARPAGAAWRQLTTEHFRFVGDASEADIRRIALRLEQFRGVVGRIFGAGVNGSPVPTVVVVFRNDAAFAPYRPLFRGKAVAAAGYFIPNDDVNYIALNAEQDSQAYGVIFHEYTHSLVHHVVGDAPVWINEGLARLYETFEARDGGRSAVLGIINREDREVLLGSTLMSTAELAAVTEQSATYLEGPRRALVYAQAGALAHYLTFGSPERARQLTTYLSALRVGVPHADAFAEVFGPDLAALDREMAAYIGRLSFAAVQVTFPDRVAATVQRAMPLTQPDAEGYLGDLLVRLERHADARALLQRTIAQSPAAGRALAALGVLEMVEQRPQAAVPLLERAASAAPEDALVVGAYGRALVRWAEQGGQDQEAGYAKAREVLQRALTLDPGSVSTAVMLAALELSQQGDVARAVALLRGVVGRVPSRENYRLMLARALAAHGDYREAANLLGPLVARAASPEMRDAARELLGQVSSALRASGAAQPATP